MPQERDTESGKIEVKTNCHMRIIGINNSERKIMTVYLDDYLACVPSDDVVYSKANQ